MRKLHLLIILTLPAAGRAQHQSPDQLLRSAKAAQQAGDLTSAIRDYRAVLAIRPKSAEAHVNLGAALAQHAEYPAAIAEFNAALPLTKPRQQVEIYLNLGLAYYKQSDYQSALPNFQTALDLQPANIQAANLVVDTDLKLNNPAAALAVAEPRAVFADQNPDFAYHYGLALLRSKHPREGATVLQHLVDAGTTPEIDLLTGTTWLQLNQIEAARRDLEIAHAANPTLPDLAATLGIARDLAGDTFAAEVAFREALQIHPEDSEVAFHLAILLLKRHQTIEAKRLLDQFLTTKPESATSLYARALLLNDVGDLKAAVTALRQSIALKPNWLDSHLLLLAVLSKLHRPEEAAAERHLVDRLTADHQSASPEP